MLSSSLMARRLAPPAYLLLAALQLHPCLCHATAAASSGGGRAAATATAKTWRLDAKAIDQGVAYVLMIAALFITYVAH